MPHPVRSTLCLLSMALLATCADNAFHAPGAVRGDDAHGYRAEFLTLVTTASDLGSESGTR